MKVSSPVLTEFIYELIDAQGVHTDATSKQIVAAAMESVRIRHTHANPGERVKREPVLPVAPRAYYEKDRQVWQARMRDAERVFFYVGSFPSQEEAIEAARARCNEWMRMAA